MPYDSLYLQSLVEPKNPDFVAFKHLQTVLQSSGNPKTQKLETGIRNPESETRIRNWNQKPETGIQNLESTNQRKQVLQVRENHLA